MSKSKFEWANTKNRKFKFEFYSDKNVFFFLPALVGSKLFGLNKYGISLGVIWFSHCVAISYSGELKNRPLDGRQNEL